MTEISCKKTKYLRNISKQASLPTQNPLILHIITKNNLYIAFYFDLYFLHYQTSKWPIELKVYNLAISISNGK